MHTEFYSRTTKERDTPKHVMPIGEEYLHLVQRNWVSECKASSKHISIGSDGGLL
jgi:hypothetical protein